MATPQDRPLKSIADEMTSLLSRTDDAAVRLRERLGVRPGFVGIWEAGSQGHERSAALHDDWILWADVQTIPPKTDRKRVVLLGESVARGFLYDPDFNPAKALEAILPGVLGQPVEIVDLAKVDLKAPHVTGLLGTVSALEPDALVIFAGNNWQSAGKRDPELEASVLREQGAPGLKALREERIAGFVDILRRQLTELSAALPIVLVIPEINLADWRLDATADAPWLSPGRNRRWLECRAAAWSALAAQRFNEAEALAREMVDLDGGTAASGWTILADCAHARGDLSAARAYLEKARDAHAWDFAHQTPRTLSVIQQALRDCALPGRIAIVDLPSCFTTWQNGEPAGRRLFLDYCHLSAEGIRVAMAATALELANLLDATRPLPGIERLANDIPMPAPHLEATAHFAAALHSSYWGQSDPFISYLCHEAARQSDEVAKVMWEYLEVQTRRAPIWASAAFERLSSVATPFLRRYILHNQKLFQPVLLPAIADALEKKGMPALAFLDELRRKERSVSERPLDLLDPYHRPSLSDPDWSDRPPLFRRVYSPASRFPWVSSAPRDTDFTLNCRQRRGTDPGECRVRINGTCVIHLPLTHEWNTHRFSVPGNLVKSGVNWLEIEWPVNLQDGEDEIGHVAHEHGQGRFVPLLPSFADISSLSVIKR